MLALQVLSFNGSRFRDPYAILGVEAGSSEGEVKRAYRKLAKQVRIAAKLQCLASPDST